MSDKLRNSPSARVTLFLTGVSGWLSMSPPKNLAGRKFFFDLIRKKCAAGPESPAVAVAPRGDRRVDSTSPCPFRLYAFCPFCLCAYVPSAFVPLPLPPIPLPPLHPLWSLCLRMDLPVGYG